MSAEWRPRFSFDITEEQWKRANDLIATHGMRKALFQPILDDVLDMLQEHGQIIAGIIMGGKARPKEVLRILSQAEVKARRAE